MDMTVHILTIQKFHQVVAKLLNPESDKKKKLCVWAHAHTHIVGIKQLTCHWEMQY